VTVIRLATLDDPRVDDYRLVRDPELARDRGLFVAEGRRVVARLLAGCRYGVRSLLLSETALLAMAHLLNHLGRDVPVYVGTPAALAAAVGHDVHRGCLALGERVPLPLLAGLLESSQTLVVLERVGNADNVGGVFRSALAFGADAVLCGTGCCDPLYRKAIRTSMGATLDVPFTDVTPWPHGLEMLRSSGFTLVALTPNTGDRDGCSAGIETIDSFFERGRPDRVALLLGSEGEGLTPSVVALADSRIRIPMVAGVDSLNVSVAAGIALARLFELGQGQA
jgi:tRNA G18 (ribose-2'-O)-methylase SpoU